MELTHILEENKFSHPLITKHREKYNEDFIALDTGFDLIILHENSDIIAALSYSYWVVLPTISLIELLVKPEFRRMGYGTKIMKCLFKIAEKRKKGIDLICRPENIEGQKFFTNLKFTTQKNRVFVITYEELKKELTITD